MKVTNVFFKPPNKAVTGLIPELMGSVGAKYSRSDLGLEEILKEIKEVNQEKMIDRIYKHVDYGHHSISDMSIVALAIEGVSMLAAMFIFNQCQVCGGQENSTRYIKLDGEGYLSPDYIYPELKVDYLDFIKTSFENYKKARSYWEKVLEADQSLAGIKETDDEKKRTRLINNFALDRSRYFLPLASLTNLFLVQSSGEWGFLCRELLSSTLPEFYEIGEKIKQALEESAPRIVKYCTSSACSTKAQKILDSSPTRFGMKINEGGYFSSEYPGLLKTSEDVVEPFILEDLNNRITSGEKGKNRYERFSDRSKFATRHGFTHCPLGEVRDFNRHRPGARIISRIPNGFYCAQDMGIESEMINYLHESTVFIPQSLTMNNSDIGRDWNFQYFLNLGTTVEYNHVSTWDKFVYLIEIRTGAGAHFKYKKMSKSIANLLKDQVVKLLNIEN